MPETMNSVRGCRKRILVLDDEALILMDLEFSLADAGFTPVTASSAERALALIEEDRPDAAVLDVNLGRGNTCEPVAARLKDIGVPFVLHTGDLDRQGEMVTRFEVPIVAKPSSPEEIRQAILSL
ncbi:Alkaline phosphatase synthesis transcriptional regulatory protein PhoP [Sulfitobacter sp. THAF37]|uniref:response regulator n=1 Tax=Sulfitobacter sp. THAF37 TaxID=2587855 RepID=UPI0012678D49|nr:response regulator [Sulfitobacter sp. THAF37]QFT57505.1 Alkaline phosphatase synthesis transcriptional regulatory protein PhoP [Sulfitobacter sp. THAF37]